MIQVPISLAKRLLEFLQRVETQSTSAVDHDLIAEANSVLSSTDVLPLHVTPIDAHILGILNSFSVCSH